MIKDKKNWLHATSEENLFDGIRFALRSDGVSYADGTPFTLDELLEVWEEKVKRSEPFTDLQAWRREKLRESLREAGREVTW